jgi:methionyl aminopeptidase
MNDIFNGIDVKNPQQISNPHIAQILKIKNFKDLAEYYHKHFRIFLKTDEQIAGIKRACKLAALILDKTCKMANEGVTTNELNDYAHALHIEYGATAAPLNYGHPPFPKSICTSLNEVICHGIPNNIPLKKGDIINIDVTTKFEGYFGDVSAMVSISDISEDKKLVVEVSKECLYKAIDIVKPLNLIKNIGDVIEPYAASKGCSTVRQFVGHGTGVLFHESPQIPHCLNNIIIPFVPAMTFTIEPMINRGCVEHTLDKNDHWTVRTKDLMPSAQWEHTLLVTNEGCEVLTITP